MKTSTGVIILALLASINLGLALFLLLQTQDDTARQIEACIFLGLSLFCSLGTIVFAIKGINEVAGMISIASNNPAPPEAEMP